MTEETSPTEPITKPAPRRGRPPGSRTTTTRAARTAGAARRRRSAAAGTGALDALSALVDQLIKENRALRRKVTKVEAQLAKAGAGQASKTIAAMERKVRRAIEPPAAPKTRRRRKTA